ncbi:hypothetical protein [Brevundimonas diminuta]|uniref:hypothetical protein n=1 Tax=Brevundimonas diminuta TaxID=293 RepID=UPI0002EDFF2C|nr:hypothetical protein [Brevundimonas diminuta]OWR16573.1 hypothetical protein CD944_16260 [Brevundimonas diminuta]WQE44818.1 hypothetical protein U0020_14660 [Brevundimonas diminuta]SUW17331.1 Uncharacterised protein [Brevundimonas diminuta]
MAEVKHTPGPKADVLIRLTNPESGYVSETAAKVTASDWQVIDRVICGSGHLYAAAPELFEALEAFSREYDGFEDGNGDPCPILKQARAALSKSTAQQEGR